MRKYFPTNILRQNKQSVYILIFIKITNDHKQGGKKIMIKIAYMKKEGSWQKNF